MKTNNHDFNITATATAEQLYTAAEIAVSIALRTLHSRTGLTMYQDLIRAYHNDRTARAAADIQTRITTAEAHRDDCRRMARAAAAIADRLTATEEERTAAIDEAAAWTAEADREAGEAKDTAAALHGITFSDRADMTQEAAAAIVETWSNPAEVTENRRADYAAAIGKEPDELTAEELEDLQTAANFRAAINAARRASTQLAHPDSKNSTTTKSRPITAAELAEWIDTMGGTGADIKRTAYRKNTAATDCWDTVEYKDTKTAPGWYHIRHYRTIRRYDSYELMQEESGNEAAAPAEDEAAAAMLSAIVSRANLTQTERTAVAAFCINAVEAPTEDERKTAAKVDQAAAEARAAYMDSRAAAIAKADSKHRAEVIARAEATAANRATAARWTAALTAAGVKSERSRQRAQAAIIAALKGAAEQPTAVYITPDKTSRRPDMVEAMSRAAEAITAAPVIQWHEFRVLEAAAPCVTGWRTRAAKSAAESAEAIRAAKHQSRIDNTTPEAKAAAEAAARAYAEKEAAKSAEAAQKAAEAARADRLSKAKAAAIRAGVCTNSTTFDQWQKWTEEQRTAYTEYLTARTA